MENETVSICVSMLFFICIHGRYHTNTVSSFITRFLVGSNKDIKTV